MSNPLSSNLEDISRSADLGEPEAIQPNRFPVVESAKKWLALSMVVFHLAVASPWWFAPGFLFRGIHLLAALLLAILMSQTRQTSRVGTSANIILAVGSLVSVGYIAINYQTLLGRVPWTQQASTAEFVLALVAVVTLLTITRRLLGIALASLCVIAIAYALRGDVLREVPGLAVLAHAGTSVDNLIDQLYLSYEGIFGIALAVSASFIFLFVVFGSLLERLGGGDYFLSLSHRVAGRFRGGPAKVAVVASAIFASISGSAAANVVTTGNVTIPLMRRVGLRR